MDEPLSNLDAKLRVQTRAELIELRRRLRATILYVTHDQVEAMTMGDRIAILDQGVLQQVAGRRRRCTRRPANLFVARFIGNPPMNTITGDVTRQDGALGVRIPGGVVTLPPALGAAVEQRGLEQVVVGVRPEHLAFVEGGPVKATVSVIEALGHERHVICRLEDGQLLIVAPACERRAARRGERDRLQRRTREPARLRRQDRGTHRRMSTPVDAAIDLRPHDEVASAPTPPRRRFSRRAREAGLGYLLLLPAFLIFAVFIFYPFFRNFYLGFFSTPPFPGLPKNYVGFDQYRDVLSSSDFLDSLRITIAFAIITVPIGIALGLVLAVLAHQKLKGIGIYRTIFSSTVATSVAVASVIFGTLFNPQVGLLPWIGSTRQPPLLDNPDLALLAVAVTTIWQNLGLSFILMSAGLQAIPDELHEAAEIDGAGPWTRFWRVTLPLLSPTIFFAVVVGSIFAFQTFGQIDILTPRGGPLKSTNVLTYFIYDQLQLPRTTARRRCWPSRCSSSRCSSR